MINNTNKNTVNNTNKDIINNSNGWVPRPAPLECRSDQVCLSATENFSICDQQVLDLYLLTWLRTDLESQQRSHVGWTIVHVWSVLHSCAVTYAVVLANLVLVQRHKIPIKLPPRNLCQSR